MVKQFMVTVCVLMLGMNAQAQTETKQTVLVNGVTIDKTVQKLTFEGDQVVLSYTDQTTQRADMEQVSISFVYTSTGIAEMVRTDAPGRKVFNLNGQFMGEDDRSLPKGVYIVNGQKVIIK